MPDTPVVWTWKCMSCDNVIVTPFKQPPVCACSDPYFVAFDGDIAFDPVEEQSRPDPSGDWEARVLWLVDQYGGQLFVCVALPGRPPTTACWRPPHDGEERISWQESQAQAYAKLERWRRQIHPTGV